MAKLHDGIMGTELECTRRPHGFLFFLFNDQRLLLSPDGNRGGFEIRGQSFSLTLFDHAEKENGCWNMEDGKRDEYKDMVRESRDSRMYMDGGLRWKEHCGACLSGDVRRQTSIPVAACM